MRNKNLQLLGGYLLAAVFAFATSSTFAADAVRGKKIFLRCAICHFAQQEANKIGPTLKNVLGRPAASVSQYHYSHAMSDAGKNGLVWTKDNLVKYLKNPSAMVKGTRMAAVNLTKEQDVEDLIAYLQSVADKKAP